MTLTTNAKWAIAVAILVIGFISFAGVQSHMITKYQQVAAAALQKASDDAVRVVVADKERDAAKATADTWKGQAVAALARPPARHRGRPSRWRMTTRPRGSRPWRWVRSWVGPWTMRP
jgi:Tfp pilus assembly protein PilV